MSGISGIGHNQQEILTVLFEYSERYPDQWVPHYRLINDLKMAETDFSQAIKRLVEPHPNGNDFNPLVELTLPSIAYREFEGGVIPLPDMKFAWEGSEARRHFYRITELGVAHLQSLTSGNRRQPSATPTTSRVSPTVSRQRIS